MKLDLVATRCSLRRGAFALGLVVLMSAQPVAAQSPGTAEYSMKAGHEAVIEPRSTSDNPVPLPPRPAPSSPQQATFGVGDRVEVQHAREDWRAGTVIRVAPSACAYYTVRYDAYGNGPADLGFSCGSVRAAARPAATPPLPTPGGALSLGTYTCDYKPTFSSPARKMGTITLREGGVYTYLSNGGSGRYRHDVASGVIAWLSGPLRERHPARTTYRRNRNTAQIDILFTGVYEWSCGRNL